MRTPLPLEIFTGWLALGERGISSEAMVSQMTGLPVGRRWGSDHPYDLDDFRRCELLLRAVPLARVFLPEMQTRSPQWASLVVAWDQIVEAFEEEVPGVFDRWPRGAQAPKAGSLMRQALKAVS